MADVLELAHIAGEAEAAELFQRRIGDALGLDAELGLDRELMENVRLKSRLSAFQAFGQVGDEAPDVLFENVLLLKVNDLLNVRLDAAALYDADVSPDVQFREVVSVGVSVALL